MGKKADKKNIETCLDQARAVIYFCCRALIYSAVLMGAIWFLIDAALYFGSSGDFTVQEIAISGTNWATKEEIQDRSEVRIGSNIWFVPSARVAQRVARHPWVRFCRVDKIPPSRVLIFIEERQPICAILDRRDGVLHGLNKEGIVLPMLFDAYPDREKPIDETRITAVRGLPFMTGPEVILIPGHELGDARYRQALKLITEFRELSPEFYNSIESVHIEEDGWIEMFPTQYAEQVMFPPDIPETLPKEFINVWDLIKRESLKVKYIDARFPKAGIAIRPLKLDPGRWYELCRGVDQSV